MTFDMNEEDSFISNSFGRASLSLFRTRRGRANTNVLNEEMMVSHSEKRARHRSIFKKPFAPENSFFGANGSKEFRSNTDEIHLPDEDQEPHLIDTC